MTELKLKSEEIHCDNCASRINTALSALKGVHEVNVDVPSKTVFVKFDEPANERFIISAMAESGFGVTEQLR